MPSYTSASTLADNLNKRTPKLEKILAKLVEYEQSTNIAELLKDEGTEGDKLLEKIGADVEREYKIDKKSREEWETTAERAMDIALQVRKPKNYPFEGAANIKYPLVTVAALQFNARAYPAIVDGNNIVKGQVVGNDSGVPMKDENGDPRLDPLSGEPLWITKPGYKAGKAERVSKHMSFQLSNEMEEWEEDTDVLLAHLPIVGCAFRKVWRSEELARNKAEMVPAVHFVVNQKTRNLKRAPRATHEIFLYPQEIEERKRFETFCDIDLPAPINTGDNDDDAPQMFLEQHRYLDLDEDGYKEPYIVTVHKDSCKVMRIVANFRMEGVKDNGKRITRIENEQYFVKYDFFPDPKGGFYGIGFGTLLESLSETIDTTINQMLDAGHLQNAGGGFIGTGIRMKKREIRVSPGRFEQVETSGALKDQIYPHQFAGPSPVLFQLLGMMVEAAKDITATKDILTGDSGGKVQTATTTLALIEQGLKVFTAIYKRVYRSLKDEFKLLFELNRRHIDEKAYFTFNDEQEAVEKDDYDSASMDVVPVADPSTVTDMQKSAKAGVLQQISQDPVLGPKQNPEEVLKRIYAAAGIEDPDKLIIKAPQGPGPMEQLTLADLEAEVEKKKAATQKDQAVAAKTVVETHLLPAEAILKAHAQDAQDEHQHLDRLEQSHANMLDSAHKHLDREQAKVAAVESADKIKETA